MRVYIFALYIKQNIFAWNHILNHMAHSIKKILYSFRENLVYENKRSLLTANNQNNKTSTKLFLWSCFIFVYFKIFHPHCSRNLSISVVYYPIHINTAIFLDATLLALNHHVSFFVCLALFISITPTNKLIKRCIANDYKDFRCANKSGTYFNDDR